MNVDAIPLELRERPQWVLWRGEERDGKRTKVPYRADGRGRASSTDPATWATFEDTCEALAVLNCDGAGYVFSVHDPYFGLDLDGELSEADRAAIVSKLGTYTEESVSGNGYHVIGRGKLEAGRHPTGFGAFDRGRYFVMTGRHVRGTPTTIEDRQAELDEVLKRFLPKRAPSARFVHPTSAPVDLDDRQLLERAFAAKNGAAIERLWSGDAAAYGDDHSSADLALLGYLRFWTGDDPARLDALFRRSGLMRDKWDERRGDSTYGAQTIARALEGPSGVYSSSTAPRARGPESTARRAVNDAASVATVLDAVRAYLDVAPGEETFILATLAAAVSKALTDEDPLWLMIVGVPGAGKTEAIRLLDDVADRRVDELTRAGLLSRAPGKTAKPVGLLKRIPAEALVTISDFSTVVTMGDREARARMFGMLRVVYDGHVYRGIGGEPASDGDELEWSGHLTLIAGATPAVDTHTSFEGALGERWITIRLPESDAQRARARARYVAGRRELEGARAEARALVRDLVLAARRRIPTQLPAATVEKLVDLSAFVAHARTGVVHEGQGRNRVVVGLPTPEEPTRLMGQLGRFYRCCAALGLNDRQALELTTKAAFDSVPAARMKALHAVADRYEHGASVSDVHRALGRGNRWAARWELDALDAIGLVDVTGPPQDEEASAARVYRLAADWQGVYESVAFSYASSSYREEATEGSRHFRTPSGPHSEGVQA